MTALDAVILQPQSVWVGAGVLTAGLGTEARGDTDSIGEPEVGVEDGVWPRATRASRARFVDTD